MHILGVHIDNMSKEEIFQKIGSFLNEDNFHQIATVNPEFVLAAQKDDEFRKILSSCNLNIADGIGIKFAFFRFRKKLKHRMAGADLMQEILEIATDRGLGVYLVANKDGLSSWEETATAIRKIYPNLKIEGINIDKYDPSYKLQATSYRVFLCNFGHPYQELFLNKQKSAIIGVAMGVGGSFDFWTGKLHRAPKLMQKMGLEWLFRLIQQPRRFSRIFKAVIIFPIKIIINNIHTYDNQS
jgi:N-acetylglucosaminyldiphosphoundecaprenol N-acetyl-beta-D-mannosaminyltransferase